jgi:hypothetical protein
MVWSAKASDLRRDPRYTLHSVVADPDTGEGELKLYWPSGGGRPGPARSGSRCVVAGLGVGKARVFTLHIGQAVFIDWDIKRALMTVHRWSPAGGYAVASRPYP